MHLAGIYVAGKCLTENYISAVPGVKVAVRTKILFLDVIAKKTHS